MKPPYQARGHAPGKNAHFIIASGALILATGLAFGTSVTLGLFILTTAFVAIGLTLKNRRTRFPSTALVPVRISHRRSSRHRRG